MKTIKVSEAEGVVLDYLVAKCEGKHYGDIGHGQIYVHNPDGTLYCSKNLWIPSTNWSQGGPIIERECIATYASGACSVSPKNPDYWVAEILATDEMLTQFGPTPLLAAMRCYVASKLGDTAEVPEELL